MTSNPYWLGLRRVLLGWMLMSILGAISLGMMFSKQAAISETSLHLQQQLHALERQVTQQSAYQGEATFYFSNQARWEQRGMFKAANPALWVAAWTALQQQAHLAHMQFGIQSPTTCESAACSPFLPGDLIAGLSMTVTTVNIRWAVRHEAEVLDWLQYLQHQYADMWLVHSCTWSVAESTDLIKRNVRSAGLTFPIYFLAH